MHICFLTNEYPLTGHPHGGIGSFVQTLGRSLVQRGMTVSILGINYVHKNTFEIDQGVNIYRLKLSKWPKFKFIKHFNRLNRMLKAIHEKNPIDILEGSELSFAFIKKIPDISYIIRLHGGHHFFAESENRGVNWWKAYQEKRSFKKADSFIAVSEYAKFHTAKYLDFKGKTINVIKYPIDVSTFQASEPNKVEPRKIIFAGTVCEKKGIRQLIDATLLLKSDYPDITLDIYGRDWCYPDGKSYIDYLYSIYDKGVFEFVKFKGSIPRTNLAAAYSQGEVCVFPSHMETQGLVALEAMATGRPVIFTNRGPGPETISHLVNGLLCDPHSPKDIATCIAWCFNNPSQAAAIGLQARSRILEEFAQEIIIEKNLQHYSEILRTI